MSRASHEGMLRPVRAQHADPDSKHACLHRVSPDGTRQGGFESNFSGRFEGLANRN
ncbi:hypothetical protein PUN4_1070039 [Paraburkholderia unamae]|nr:hypothetical protein PUN4_1070039 [Paraburkholderia unamae]